MSSHSSNALTDIVAIAGTAPPTTNANNSAVTPVRNGDGSPIAESINASQDAPHESESDLSDYKGALPAATTSLSTATDPDEQPDFDVPDADSPTQSDNEDVNASDDGDYEMDQSPPPPQNGPIQSSSSPDPHRPSSKRKAVHDNDEYIKANPELYGLRRSVCLLNGCCNHWLTVFLRPDQLNRRL